MATKYKNHPAPEKGSEEEADDYYTAMNPPDKNHPAPKKRSEEIADDYYTAMNAQDKNRPTPQKASGEAAATYYTAMNPPPNNDSAPAPGMENEDMYEQTPGQEMADEEIYEPTPGQLMGAEASFKVSQTSNVLPYEEFTASMPGRQAAVTSKLDEEIKKVEIEITSHKRFLCMLITLVVAALAIVACFIAVFVEVAALKSQSEMTSAQLQSLSMSLMQDPMSMSTSGDLVSLQQLNNSIYSLDNRATEQINGIEVTVENSFSPPTQPPDCGPCNFNERLNQLENAVVNNSTIISSLQEEHVRLNVSVNDLSRMLENHMQLLYTNTTFLSFNSCTALPPSAINNFYFIRNIIGFTKAIFCDMTRTCGGITGGWMRVVQLDTNNYQCPSGFTLRADGSIFTCVRDTSTAGCSSVTLPTESISYSRVCGRATGYQIGSTDGFHSDLNIDHLYVDGIILTYGFPTRHLWTFAVGLDRASSVEINSCPCQVSSISSPSFVGNDYFCDSGLSRYTGPGPAFLQNDPLWTDSSCLCCPNPPWFYRQLSQPINDDIEMRVCRNEANDNEDIALQLVEIFIQ